MEMLIHLLKCIQCNVRQNCVSCRDGLPTIYAGDGIIAYVDDILQFNRSSLTISCVLCSYFVYLFVGIRLLCCCYAESWLFRAEDFPAYTSKRNDGESEFDLKRSVTYIFEFCYPVSGCVPGFPT